MSDIVEQLSLGEICFQSESGPVYSGPTSKDIEAIKEIQILRHRVKALEDALTPTGNTKAEYIGEFYIEVEDFNPDYDEDFDVHSLLLSSYSNEELGQLIRLSTSPTLRTNHPVDWTTIKNIMKAIKEYADGLSGSSKN